MFISFANQFSSGSNVWIMEGKEDGDDLKLKVSCGPLIGLVLVLALWHGGSTRAPV